MHNCDKPLLNLQESPFDFVLQANAGPWVRLAQETGAVVKWWRVQRSPPFATPLGDLKDLLSPRSACPAGN